MRLLILGKQLCIGVISMLMLGNIAEIYAEVQPGVMGDHTRDYLNKAVQRLRARMDKIKTDRIDQNRVLANQTANIARARAAAPQLPTADAQYRAKKAQLARAQANRAAATQGREAARMAEVRRLNAQRYEAREAAIQERLRAAEEQEHRRIAEAHAAEVARISALRQLNSERYDARQTARQRAASIASARARAPKLPAVDALRQARAAALARAEANKAAVAQRRHAAAQQRQRVSEAQAIQARNVANEQASQRTVETALIEFGDIATMENTRRLGSLKNSIETVVNSSANPNPVVDNLLMRNPSFMALLNEIVEALSGLNRGLVKDGWFDVDNSECVAAIKKLTLVYHPDKGGKKYAPRNVATVVNFIMELKKLVELFRSIRYIPSQGLLN